MGNCYPAQLTQTATSTLEINIQGLQLPCMICNEQYSPQQLRTHLDQIHYMQIKDSGDGIVCQCIICGESNSSTQRHNQHLEKFHFSYMDRYRKSSILGTPSTLNSQLRQKIKQINIQQINNIRRIETEDGSFDYCDYLGCRYSLTQTQEQDVIGLDEKYVVSNLIWKQIFMKYPDTQYYAIGEIDGSKRGYLLRNY